MARQASVTRIERGRRFWRRRQTRTTPALRTTARHPSRGPTGSCRSLASRRSVAPVEAATAAASEQWTFAQEADRDRLAALQLLWATAGARSPNRAIDFGEDAATERVLRGRLQRRPRDRRLTAASLPRLLLRARPKWALLLRDLLAEALLVTRHLGAVRRTAGLGLHRPEQRLRRAASNSPTGSVRHGRSGPDRPRPRRLERVTVDHLMARKRRTTGSRRGCWCRRRGGRGRRSRHS